MKKKTIGIIVVLVVIAIGIAVAIGAGGGEKPGNTPGKTPANSEQASQADITDLGEDVDVSAGVEESIFDEESTDDSQDKPSDDADREEQDEDATDDEDEDADQDTDAGIPSDGEMDYESFHAMDPSDQQKYMESFDDLDAFFDWYNDIKAQYEKDHPSIEIDGGEIDLGELN